MVHTPPPPQVDVLVVGAGLSGICAAHYLRTEAPWAEFSIVESRHSLGGTWDLFRYPGVRSDSDMHTLGFSFRPWSGADSIADGGDILRYLHEVADAEGITERLRFGWRMVAADWSSEQARWTVTLAEVPESAGDAEVPASGGPVATATTTTVSCSFLFVCAGYYRYDRGHLPEFVGIDTFTGTVVHPQFWPEGLEVAGRRVVVIGSGATAVTLVPALAERGAQVTMLQRSPTWMTSMPRRNPLARAAYRALPDSTAAHLLRWGFARGTQASYRLSKRRPELMARLLRRGVERELPEGFDVERHFTPTYDPWDQRLCAVTDGDLFREIREGRVEVVTDQVDHIDPSGIVLASGTRLDADVIVTATGLELLFVGGAELSVDGEPVELSERLAYKGMMVEGVPNLAVTIGYTNASWTLRAELISHYVCRLLNHLRATGLRQVTPRNTDPGVTPEPLLGLNAGYVARAAARLPKAGSRFPWRVEQSYPADVAALRRAPLTDDAMEFSNAAPVRVRTGSGSV